LATLLGPDWSIATFGAQQSVKSHENIKSGCIDELFYVKWPFTRNVVSIGCASHMPSDEGCGDLADREYFNLNWAHSSGIFRLASLHLHFNFLDKTRKK